MRKPNPVGLPDNIFSTPSPLVAAWVQYFRKRVQFMRYDAERMLYLFYDPDHISQSLINEYSLGDPTVNMKRFNKLYNNVVADKQREEARYRHSKAVNRG